MHHHHTTLMEGRTFLIMIGCAVQLVYFVSGGIVWNYNGYHTTLPGASHVISPGTRHVTGSLLSFILDNRLLCYRRKEMVKSCLHVILVISSDGNKKFNDY